MPNPQFLLTTRSLAVLIPCGIASSVFMMILLRRKRSHDVAFVFDVAAVVTWILVSFSLVATLSNVTGTGPFSFLIFGGDLTFLILAWAGADFFAALYPERRLSHFWRNKKEFWLNIQKRLKPTAEPAPVVTETIESAIEDKPVATPPSDFRDKFRIPAHGEILFECNADLGTVNFAVSKLSFEKIAYDIRRGEHIFMWWVSGRWASDNREQTLTLPLYLNHCERIKYSMVSSRIMRSLWGQPNVPPEGIGNILLILQVIAIPIMPYDEPTQAIGLWPGFEGEWNEVKRFAEMLTEHRRIDYYKFCFLNYQAIQGNISAAIRAEPIPPESHAKVFVNSCGDFWSRMYLARRNEILEVLAEKIHAVSQLFNVYPVADFEVYGIEDLLHLFKDNKKEFLENIVKEGKQKISGMLNIKIKTEGPWFQPFDDENNRMARIEKRERDKIEKTIKWCEIELNPMGA